MWIWTSTQEMQPFLFCRTTGQLTQHGDCFIGQGLVKESQFVHFNWAIRPSSPNRKSTNNNTPFSSRVSLNKWHSVSSASGWNLFSIMVDCDSLSLTWSKVVESEVVPSSGSVIQCEKCGSQWANNIPELENITFILNFHSWQKWQYLRQMMPLVATSGGARPYQLS